MKVKVPVVWRTVNCDSVKRAFDAEDEEAVHPTKPEEGVIIDGEYKEAIIVDAQGRVKYCFPVESYDLEECYDWIEHDCYDITDYVKECIEKRG